MSRIQELNDAFRTTSKGGRSMMTAGVKALPHAQLVLAVLLMRSFEDFSQDNDPHDEHDFGSFESAGNKFFWKIDYYNNDMSAGSEDPSDPKQTIRVITLMLASEY